jgi:hypothetical protein
VTAANLRACSPWTAGITCLSTPRAETLACSLPQLVDSALAIFAADLLAESLRATLGTVKANTPEFAAAMCLLALLVEEASPPTRAAHLAPIQKARA